MLEVSYSDSGQYQCLAVDETANILFQSDVGILSVQGMQMIVLLECRGSCVQLFTRAASILTASDARHHPLGQTGYLSVQSY